VRAILVTIALLAIGFRQTPQAPAPVPPPAALPVADEAIQQFVRAALEDRLAAKSLPDYGVLRDQTRMGIREDMPAARLRLDQRAVPHAHGLDFFLISQSAAQAQADRTKNTIIYLTVERPVITGDDASLVLGVDIAIPTNPRAVKMCCCDAEAHFQRVKGHWTFVKWGLERCS
jgi:hypothetical protein